jgi:hypothetical protein
LPFDIGKNIYPLWAANARHILMTMKRFRTTAARWAPLIIWMALIFLVSHQPKESIPDYGQWDLVLKKGGHLLAYGILAILARRARLNSVGVFVLVVLYAATDELHQRFVPGRTGRVADVLIDFLGAALSYPLLRLLPRRLREALLGQTSNSDERSLHDV